MDKYKSVFYSGPCKYGADGSISGRAHAGMQIRFFQSDHLYPFRCFRYTGVCRLHIRSRGNSRAHRRFFRRLYHVRSHMRPASQKKRFVLSYHADDMRSYRLLRFGVGVVYDPHSLDSVGRFYGLRHSVSARRRCKDNPGSRVVEISRQSLPFAVKGCLNTSFKGTKRAEAGVNRRLRPLSVSYTHLTLPTT